KAVAEAAVHQRAGLRTVLFIDEIHRFNKAQQDAILPHVENGTVTLIGATTENPSFEVIAPLLSRSRVFRLEALDRDELKRVVERGLGELNATIGTDAMDALLEASRGDARVALNGLEASAALAGSDEISLERLAAGGSFRLHARGGAATDRGRALPRACTEVQLRADLIRRRARAHRGDGQRTGAAAPTQRGHGSHALDGLWPRLQVRARFRGRRREPGAHAREAEEAQGVQARPA